MEATDSKCFLDLKVGYSCNNNCIHCVIQDDKQSLVYIGKAIDLTTQECLELINKAGAEGTTSVVITGGEASIRPDFIELLSACDSYDMKIGVQTNGRKFHNRDFCSLLCAIRKDRINFGVALHGPNQQIHDKITQRNGSFEQTTRGIVHLLEAGFEVHGKVVLSRINADHLVETLRFLHSMGVRHINFGFPHGLGNARINFSQVIPRYREIRSEIDKLVDEAKNLSMQIELETFPYCTVSDPSLVAEFKYWVLDTLNARWHSVPVHEDEYDWSSTRSTIKAKFPQCQSCSYDKICEGPWREYPEAFGSEEFQPLTDKSFTDLLMRALQLARD